jgi:Kdo2-lipid IVA lauroyltransferase/acyltransferase
VRVVSLGPATIVAARLGAKAKHERSGCKGARYALEFAAVAAFEAWVRLLPRGVVLLLARGLGNTAYLLLRRDRRVALANLEIVLRNAVPVSEKRRIARATFRRLASVVLGLFWAPRMTRRRLDSLLDGEETLADLRGLAARGKGVIVATAHYGDWELACHAMGLLGLPLLIVTEPMPNKRIEMLFERLRASSGNRAVPPRYAALKLFRALRQGGRVAMMVDVNGRRARGGVWLDFFGLQVFNGSALAELALRTGAAVCFVAAKPLPGGRTRLIHRPPIEFAPTGDHAADVQALSQQVLDCCRDLIREDPGPWLWTYKRWKRLPTPGAEGYPFYSRYAETG